MNWNYNVSIVKVFLNLNTIKLDILNNIVNKK